MTTARTVPQVPTPPALDLTADPAELTAALIDVESVSGNEGPLADAVEAALRSYPNLRVHRDGDAIVARTELGRSERVVLAGHLDTVPLPSVEGSRGTVPSSWSGTDADDDRVLWGRGATDMKGGVAVQLALAASLTEPNRDVTYVFYDHEEVDSAKSGLARLYRNAPEMLEADFAVLLEPTNGTVEGGCNGTLRFTIDPAGLAAHSGRAWRGENAIHKLADVLSVLAEYEPREIEVEGLVYREGLNAIRIQGGVAGNVIPDAARVEINYRFAPDKSLDQAQEHCRELFPGHELTFVDLSPAARPGLDRPSAAAFVDAVGQEPQPKYGWTDVARFSEKGVPAVNFGPGDALLAHTDDEHVTAAAIRDCHRALENWLTA
ncbi:succinyl-diaminopimelate desuccinylase [Kocuria sp. JC486]|uniref:Succinyl-diaminopimelate desuccinylase n=1 Tax=Kocuria soli TaxID=2485125 RepID=A0A3N3ZP13_9MICC|nr:MULTISPECIES: succinyl-diaminopimelate desuccinylase [Kocuria]NHU85516.1 succinyl-diaminopimelate desuccinylase [Kocuria sp. JC486]ROZ62664.1 succinyl-diaminopimelate desuccinylase [Kocuria soli]